MSVDLAVQLDLQARELRAAKATISQLAREIQELRALLASLAVERVT